MAGFPSSFPLQSIRLRFRRKDVARRLGGISDAVARHSPVSGDFQLGQICIRRSAFPCAIRSLSVELTDRCSRKSLASSMEEYG